VGLLKRYDLRLYNGVQAIFQGCSLTVGQGSTEV